MGSILNPLYTAVSWVIINIHNLLSPIFGSASGVTWSLSIIGLNNDNCDLSLVVVVLRLLPPIISSTLMLNVEDKTCVRNFIFTLIEQIRPPVPTDSMTSDEPSVSTTPAAGIDTNGTISSPPLLAVVGLLLQRLLTHHSSLLFESLPACVDFLAVELLKPPSTRLLYVIDGVCL